MTRSVADLIHWAFGIDNAMMDRKRLKPWFDALSHSEQKRRHTFSQQFEPILDSFRKLDLSTARNISVHRAGYPPVEVHIRSIYGISHIGCPINRVPTSEYRPPNPHADPSDPAVQWASTLPPRLVHPIWSDFTINGKSLFPECEQYLDQAHQLLTQARAIVRNVHGNDVVTPSP
jgi:hypothetical protein